MAFPEIIASNEVKNMTLPVPKWLREFLRIPAVKQNTIHTQTLLTALFMKAHMVVDIYHSQLLGNSPVRC